MLPSLTDGICTRPELAGQHWLQVLPLRQAWTLQHLSATIFLDCFRAVNLRTCHERIGFW